jgi:hypothetical protein
VFTWIFHQWLTTSRLRCFLVAQKLCPKEKIDGLHTEIVPTERKKKLIKMKKYSKLKNEKMLTSSDYSFTHPLLSLF